MKETSKQRVFFVLAFVSGIAYFLASVNAIASLIMGKSGQWVAYAAFAILWVLGLAFGVAGQRTKKTLWWAISAACYGSYFALFSLAFGTIRKAIGGIEGDPNAATTGIIVGVAACLAVVLMFLAVFTQKRPLLIASTIVQIGLSIFYVVEFVIGAGSTFGAGQNDWLMQFAVLFEQIAASGLIASILTLHIFCFVQADTKLVDVNEAIEEAKNHENDFDVGEVYR
jgi:hypothetical protein